MMDYSLTHNLQSLVFAKNNYKRGEIDGQYINSGFDGYGSSSIIGHTDSFADAGSCVKYMLYTNHMTNKTQC